MHLKCTLWLCIKQSCLIIQQTNPKDASKEAAATQIMYIPNSKQPCQQISTALQMYFLPESPLIFLGFWLRNQGHLENSQQVTRPGSSWVDSEAKLSWIWLLLEQKAFYIGLVSSLSTIKTNLNPSEILYETSACSRTRIMSGKIEIYSYAREKPDKKIA